MQFSDQRRSQGGQGGWDTQSLAASFEEAPWQQHVVVVVGPIGALDVGLTSFGGLVGLRRPYL